MNLYKIISVFLVIVFLMSCQVPTDKVNNCIVNQSLEYLHFSDCTITTNETDNKSLWFVDVTESELIFENVNFKNCDIELRNCKDLEYLRLYELKGHPRIFFENPPLNLKRVDVVYSEVNDMSFLFRAINLDTLLVYNVDTLANPYDYSHVPTVLTDLFDGYML